MAIIMPSVAEQSKSHKEDNSEQLRNRKGKSRDIIGAFDARLAKFELAFGDFEKKQFDLEAI